MDEFWNQGLSSVLKIRPEPNNWGNLAVELSGKGCNEQARKENLVHADIIFLYTTKLCCSSGKPKIFRSRIYCVSFFEVRMNENYVTDACY